MAGQSSSNNSTQQPTREAAILCTICGIPSRGMIYGAIACDACKKFFKRHAQRGLVKWKATLLSSIDLFLFEDALKCHFDEHCQININTRHTCAYCRLVKCFANGMQKELLRSSLSKANPTCNKKRKTTNNEVQLISTVSTRSAQVREESSLLILNNRLLGVDI